jgi:hypothetical protein
MDLKKDVSGLIAIIAYGASDNWLHGNPQMSIHIPEPHKRTTNSSFTFQTIDFVYGEDGSYRAVLSENREYDMLGKCYMLIKTKASINIDSIIKTVSIHAKTSWSGGLFEEVLETLTDKST